MQELRLPQMARQAALSLLTFAAIAVGPAAAARARGATGAARSQALLQTWDEALDGSSSGGRASSRDTPVTRAVNLLKEMQGTLQKEMTEDEELYDKLACWCNNNEYGKGEAISTSESKISELTATIESLTAKSAGLKTSIKELEGEAAADKSALAEAMALREKQQKEFHGSEVDSIQAIENLKAAIEVLSKHHAKAPESTVAGGAIFKSERDSWESLLSVDSRDEPWSAEHEMSRVTRSLDDFMRRNGFDDAAAGEASPVPERRAQPKFLQNEAAPASEWSMDDSAVVKRALTSASAFMQAHHRSGYYPAYQSQSGEIFGVLKQLKEEMEGDLSESQKREQARAATFAELRSAKTAEIENGEKMAEQKEDELATTMNNLAEGKEDLGQEQATLSADQKFMANLKKTCAEASKNFQERKAARLEEIKAVSEAIGILTEDTARDAMTGTYSFLQGAASAHHESHRRKAAQVLRQMARKSKDPQLSILATSVELDAFTRVKKAIDDMIGMLKVQQADEVKKNDYCKSELQQNEMTITKTQDEKADLEAKSGELTSSIEALAEGIAAAKAQIAKLQLELQRASEDRQKENLEFQTTVADQTVTTEVLKKALDKLATYYDKEALVQKSSQTPPVPQMEYKPSKGSEGVMQLLEKLIQEAKGLTADSIKSESEAQAAYEQTVEDTNAAVAALQREVASKTKAKAGATKDKAQTESDIADTAAELDGLAKYNGELHADCDYVMKNFGSRQEARAQEVEALQQAKQILSGASFS